MALAQVNFHQLSHELRFLLFEAGIGLPQNAIEYFITLAHHQCLQRLQHAALMEGLIKAPLATHNAHDFINQLQQKMKLTHPASVFFNWSSLKEEVDETIGNQALAQAYRQRWALELRTQINEYFTVWDWLGETFDPYQAMQFLEQWGSTGHPYHPFFRAKTGLSRREVLQYSPEFNARIDLHWCALHKTHSQTSILPEQYKQLVNQQFPREYKLWQEKLAFKHLQADNYCPLPVHPWQWRNQLQSTFSSLIDAKQLILLPHHQTVYPSLSSRTVMPINAKTGHLKLSLAVQITSALRTISPAAAENGPQLSAWLAKLLEHYQHYQNTLFIAADLAGIVVNQTSNSFHQCQQLGFILRQNPGAWLKENDRIVPLAALFTPSPLSNQPLLVDIINASGLNPIDFFELYCQCVLSSQMHLLLHHGIALESHQQNTLIMFSNNLPQALVIRDLDDVLISQDVFYEKRNKPLPYSATSTNNPNLAELRHQFIYCNLQSNLSCWIHCLRAAYALNEKQFWQIVRQHMQKALDENRQTIEPDIYAQHYDGFMRENWQHKCLLFMRLDTQRTTLFQPTPNRLRNLMNE